MPEIAHLGLGHGGHVALIWGACEGAEEVLEISQAGRAALDKRRRGLHVGLESADLVARAAAEAGEVS